MFYFPSHVSNCGKLSEIWEPSVKTFSCRRGFIGALLVAKSLFESTVHVAIGGRAYLFLTQTFSRENIRKRYPTRILFTLKVSTVAYSANTRMEYHRRAQGPTPWRTEAKPAKESNKKFVRLWACSIHFPPKNKMWETSNRISVQWMRIQQALHALFRNHSERTLLLH